MVKVTQIKCKPEDCSKILKLLNQYLLRIPSIKPVVKSKEPAGLYCIIRLDNFKLNGKFVELRKDIAEYIVSREEKDLGLKYENLSVKDVLEKHIPKEIASRNEFPHSFETIGHVAHFNLRDKFLPYKSIIGKTIIDKIKGIRTVVNKTGAIESKFRTYPLELIAGEEIYETRVTGVNKTIYEFDVRKVYWNSRLREEHERVINLILKDNHTDNVVVDLFCGVGPFAIPLVKSGRAKVWANDLNQESFKSLLHNFKINLKKTPDLVKNYACFNEDAKDFILDKIASGKVLPTHIIMNLPGDAISFLKHFRGIFTESQYLNRDLPYVFCYSFSNADNFTQDLSERVQESLGGCVSNLTIVNVRTVSVGKVFACIQFSLTPDIAFRDIKKRKLVS